MKYPNVRCLIFDMPIRISWYICSWHTVNLIPMNFLKCLMFSPPTPFMIFDSVLSILCSMLKQQEKRTFKFDKRMKNGIIFLFLLTLLLLKLLFSMKLEKKTICFRFDKIPLKMRRLLLSIANALAVYCITYFEVASNGWNMNVKWKWRRWMSNYWIRAQ